MPLTMAPATVRRASPNPPPGYATVGEYDNAAAARSIVSIAERLVLLTKARCGRPGAGLAAIACAAARSSVAARPLFGLANRYVLAFEIAGTPTAPEISARGVSDVVFHAASASTGRGKVSRYRPSHPDPVDVCGLPVPKMSVASKCERLEF